MGAGTEVALEQGLAGLLRVNPLLSHPICKMRHLGQCFGLFPRVTPPGDGVNLHLPIGGPTFPHREKPHHPIAAII